jgi:hypothetical protein
VDYHRNSNNPVAAWLFRWQHQSKFPENRQLDSHPARYCHNPSHSEPVRDHLDLRLLKIEEAARQAVSS